MSTTIYDANGRECAPTVIARPWLPHEERDAIAGARIIGPVIIGIEGTASRFDGLSIVRAGDHFAVYYCRYSRMLRALELGDIEIAPPGPFTAPKVCDECGRWGYHLKSCTRAGRARDVLK